MLKNVLAAVTTATLLFLSVPASATPFIDIRGSWDAGPDFWSPLPDGIALSCWGGAEASSGGCGDSLRLTQSVSASTTFAASTSGGILLTNTSGAAITSSVVIVVGFSAFNPGGPSVGLGIDDPTTQWASFRSTLSGDGNISDSHACSVGYRGESGTVWSPTTCGLGAPDSSLGNVFVDLVDFLPGAELALTWSLDIAATFDLGEGPPAGVPEPATALLLAAGVTGFAARRRRALTP